MNFYQTALPDRIVGTYASSSPGSGWTSVGSFPTLVGNAQAANLPLFLLPGTYPSSQIDVASGNPLTIGGVLGQVTIQLSGSAPYLFNVNGVNNVVIENIVFDGNNIALTDTSATAGLIKFQGSGINKFLIQDCVIYNTTQAAISCFSNCSGEILRNTIYNCDRGVFCQDAGVNIERNNVGYCNNNGIMLWTSKQVGNTSIIINNYIHNISSSAGGTGQYGNGINIYRATGVRVADNNIYNCAYSAIRINAGGDSVVSGNYCATSGETAIWFEAPGSGTSLTGGICANNIIESAGAGIAVANSGLYSDGVSRRVTLIGNQISGITSVYIPNEGKNTDGCGITIEGSVNAIGNIIDTASNGGIIVGTNDAANDLVVSGNLIKGTPLGIGYSANASAAGLLISNNEVSGYAKVSSPTGSGYSYSGAIVSVSYNGTNYVRDAPGGAANTDYGNATQTVVGALTVGMNKAH
jgi:uncharacterized secreted repeat protein (TIGR03808 family)